MTLFLCMMGTIVIRYSMFDLWIMLLFGALGFLEKRAKFPTSPMVLGMSLGGSVLRPTSARRRRWDSIRSPATLSNQGNPGWPFNVSGVLYLQRQGPGRLTRNLKRRRKQDEA